jgi:hypothetical protein
MAPEPLPLGDVFAFFGLPADLRAARLGRCLIHRTFTLAHGTSPEYVLQEINTRVFADPDRSTPIWARFRPRFTSITLRRPSRTRSRARVERRNTGTRPAADTSASFRLSRTPSATTL